MNAKAVPVICDQKRVGTALVDDSYDTMAVRMIECSDADLLKEIVESKVVAIGIGYFGTTKDIGNGMVAITDIHITEVSIHKTADT